MSGKKFHVTFETMKVLWMRLRASFLLTLSFYVMKKNVFLVFLSSFKKQTKNSNKVCPDKVSNRYSTMRVECHHIKCYDRLGFARKRVKDDELLWSNLFVILVLCSIKPPRRNRFHLRSYREKLTYTSRLISFNHPHSISLIICISIAFVHIWFHLPYSGS